MSNTKEEWIKVRTVLSMMPGGMPGEKILKFFEFFENVIFLIFNLFFIKNMLLWDTFGKVKN